MTRKDYVLIAATLASEKPKLDAASYMSARPWNQGAYDVWNTTVLAFAQTLASTNPRFDRQRFMTACGVQS